MTRTQRVLAGAILFLVAYSILGIQMQAAHLDRKPLPAYLMEDYGCYSRALSRLHSGRDPYEDHSAETGYLYPPQALLFIAALESLHALPLKFAVFATGNLLALALAMALIFRETKTRGDDPMLWIVVALGLAFGPVAWSLYLGQVNVIIGFTVAAGFLLAERKPWVAGAMLALGTALKITPVLLLVLFLHRRYLKVHLGFLACSLLLTLVTGLAVGFGQFTRYIQVSSDLSHTFPVGTTGSLSMMNTLYLLGGTVHQHVERWFGPLQFLYSAFIVGLFLLGAWNTRDGQNRQLLFALVAIGATSMPNILWYHHFAAALPGLLMVLCSKESTRLLRGLTAVSFLVIQLDHLIGLKFDKITTLPICLALMLAISVELFRRGRPPSMVVATA